MLVMSDVGFRKDSSLVVRVFQFLFSPCSLVDFHHRVLAVRRRCCSSPVIRLLAARRLSPHKEREVYDDLRIASEQHSQRGSASAFRTRFYRHHIRRCSAVTSVRLTASLRNVGPTHAHELRQTCQPQKSLDKNLILPKASPSL
ncbi:hypothetical protein RJT34_25112 [Clitoria ternatea]|uniref:Uncharacterized protein n=1 Tax=Clitoria ternatea TaxID=43366 RepID=A0AAN9FVH9_CLITE